MPDRANDEAFEEIRRFFDRLAARHGLDLQTTQELCGHLEEKLVGYLSGQIPITWQDALVLARARFGDADQVCGMLAGHPVWKYHMHRRALFWVAGIGAILTILALPGWSLGLGASLRTAGLIAGSLAVLEVGLLLAVRVDLRSLWQRALSAALLLPTTGLLWFVQATGFPPLTVRTPAHLAEMKLIFSAIVTAALLAHVGLLVLLALPAGGRSESVLEPG